LSLLSAGSVSSLTGPVGGAQRLSPTVRRPRHPAGAMIVRSSITAWDSYGYGEPPTLT